MLKTIIRLVAVLIALWVGVSVWSASGAVLAGPEGHWVGALELGGQSLDFDVDFVPDAGGWKGDISIPAQGATDIPLVNVSVEGDQMSFVISGIQGDPTFKGTLAGDSVEGQFTQAGQTVPFKMTRQAPPE